MIHILNGDALAPHLDRARIEGERIVWREALAAGPTPGELSRDAFLEKRAEFLSDGDESDRAQILEELRERDRALASIPSHEEVVLWFDRDLFCRVNLWCAVSMLRQHRGAISLVDGDEFLCELEPERLRVSFENRGKPHPDAARLWEAYISATAEALNGMTEGHRFVVLHLRRFPSQHNGLGAIEQTILSIAAEGETTFTALFAKFSALHRDYAFGDAQILGEIRRLASMLDPLLTLDIGCGDSLTARVSITERGRRVAEGEERLKPADFNVWLGGVHLTARNIWEWDETKKAVRHAPPLT